MLASQTLSAALQLRPARAEDDALLFQIFAETQQQFAAILADPALVQSLLEMQYRGRKISYTAQFPGAQDLILVGEDGAPLGRLLLDCGPACWRIVDIAMLAAHRGQGWGARLLRDCQRQCAEAGAELKLQVAPANPARRLYLRLGFRIASEDAVSVEMVWNESGQGKRDEGIE